MKSNLKEGAFFFIVKEGLYAPGPGILEASFKALSGLLEIIRGPRRWPSNILGILYAPGPGTILALVSVSLLSDVPKL